MKILLQVILAFLAAIYCASLAISPERKLEPADTQEDPEKVL